MEAGELTPLIVVANAYIRQQVTTALPSHILKRCMMRYYPRNMSIWAWIKKYYYERKRDKEFPYQRGILCQYCKGENIHSCSNLGNVCFDCGTAQP